MEVPIHSHHSSWVVAHYPHFVEHIDLVAVEGPVHRLVVHTFEMVVAVGLGELVDLAVAEDRQPAVPVGDSHWDSDRDVGLVDLQIGLLFFNRLILKFIFCYLPGAAPFPEDVGGIPP